MRHRAAILLASAAMTGAGALGSVCGAACGGAGDDRAGVEDAGVDATRDAARPVDASGAENDARAVFYDGGPSIEGGCSALNSACDIVLQDCSPDSDGNSRECQQAGDGIAGGTACVVPTASQRLPKGHACCTATGAQGQCAPGLHCVGPDVDDCSADGGGLVGRCAPACCADDICGRSDPEGFAGRCTLGIVGDDDRELFRVCDYNPPCKPFQVEACPTGFTCLIDDKFGNASCVPIYNDATDGGSSAIGLPENATCRSLNACGDGLLCLGPSNERSTCRWLCLTPGANPPFDAGALRDGAAGSGGCPAGERCLGGITGELPLWVSFCTP